MSLKLKIEYLKAIRERYYNSTKKQKSMILDELCAVTGFTRKYAIKILAKKHIEGKKKSGRTRSYSTEAILHLKKLWHIMDHMCSKKMVSAFPIWLDFYEGPAFTKEIKKELLSMSASTIDRYLKTYRAKFNRSRRSCRKYGKGPKHIIPLKPFTMNIDRPGYVETDTVAHCGGSLSGNFVWSITITDVYSGWTNNMAIWGKGSGGVLSAIDKIDRILPYDMIGMNVDNGTEFLNYSLNEYLRVIKGVELTRSRPYRKNDNCFVEQKNGTHVRDTFGYERIDKKILIMYMNEIYTQYQNVLYNFFIPQLKLVKKYREGAKYRRRYDRPKTPYQRLMESQHITSKQKYDLNRQYVALNPIKLRRELSRKLSHFRTILKRIEEDRYYFVG